jgi:hypothetical protein
METTLNEMEKGRSRQMIDKKLFLMRAKARLFNNAVHSTCLCERPRVLKARLTNHSLRTTEVQLAPNRLEERHRGRCTLWHSLVNSLYQHPLVLLTPKVTRRIATPDNTFFVGYGYAAKTVAVLGA